MPTEILSIRLAEGTKDRLKRLARSKATAEDREVTYRELIRSAIEQVIAESCPRNNLT